MVRVRVRRVPAAVALVDGVGGARPHVEHDDEDEHHDAEGRHDDADHLCAGQCSQSGVLLITFPYRQNIPRGVSYRSGHPMG